MILNKRLAGTLDQGAGCLEVFEEEGDGAIYNSALDIISNMNSAVDALFARSQKIVA